MASIWSAAAATPTAAHRLPADVSAAGIPTYYSVQQIADLYISTGVTANAIGNVTGATAISLAAGGVVTATVTGNTTFSITNPPTAASEWVLILTNGGAHTITWFTTTWAGGTAPTLTASGVDVIHFATPNGGTTWYGWHETDFAVGTTAGTVAAGDDSRMTDDRTASGLRSATTVVSVSAATAPSSGQVLTATSSTAATWQTPSAGGSPGGSSGQLQYNDAGSFGASANATIDTASSAMTLGTDATIRRRAAAVMQLGAADAAAPVAQTLAAQGARGGTDSNTAAVTLTIQGSLGTGTGTVGDVDITTGTAAASGSTAHAASVRARFNSALASFYQPIRLSPSGATSGSWLFSSGSGNFRAGNGQGSSADGSFTAGRFSTGNSTVAIDDLGFSGIGLAASYKIFWSSTGAWSGTEDLVLRRDAANTLAQRNGTNAQTSRIYGTYTDASNYVRASLAATSTAVTLTAETAGTGANDVPVVISPAGVSQVEVGNGVQFTEMTAPSAPAANKVILFAQDNGAGKTQLMALFPSGAAQQVSIEP